MEVKIGVVKFEEKEHYYMYLEDDDGEEVGFYITIASLYMKEDPEVHKRILIEKYNARNVWDCLYFLNKDDVKLAINEYVIPKLVMQKLLNVI
jgi:hypothetical protein